WPDQAQEPRLPSGSVAMSYVFRLIGYDRDDERLVVEIDVPAVLTKRVLAVAGVNPDGGGPMGDYPLSETKAVRIADMIGRDINPDHTNFFLETYAEEKASA
ncbi:MAG TPA: hypothetical protein VJ822_08085, partial [Dongiaceae bacterium]|nr:hypothetical protein [Dongiaceae bacterium]